MLRYRTIHSNNHTWWGSHPQSTKKIVFSLNSSLFLSNLYDLLPIYLRLLKVTRNYLKEDYFNENKIDITVSQHNLYDSLAWISYLFPIKLLVNKIEYAHLYNAMNRHCRISTMLFLFVGSWFPIQGYLKPTLLVLGSLDNYSFICD